MYSVYFLLDDEKCPFYVGISKNPRRRIRGHFSSLIDKSRKSVYNLPVYTKMRKLVKNGINVNDMLFIKETNILNEDIDEREIYWISKLKSDGYKIKNSTIGGRSSHLSVEIQNKATKSRTGKKRSAETRKRISQSRMGIIFSEEHKSNLSKARRERIISKETIIKTSKTSKGKINIKVYLLIDERGREWHTTKGLTLFCEEHNLSAPNMHNVITGKRKSHKGWKVKIG